ncbi:MAG: alpha/beta hydrolase [Acidobacteria bacterium]|nr:MAG: alpha/beta hydrolase [Acidobacteriota bacterium]
MKRRPLNVIAPVLALLGTTFVLWEGCGPRVEKVVSGKFPEELVYVSSADDIPNCGAIFTPPKNSAKPIAIIWIHGWGVNFYVPTYVMIGRHLAERGYTCISANTRMHDVGFNIGERGGKRLRGGGYWGRPSEEVRDLAAWIDLAGDRGFENVVLVGHSAGWAAARLYQSQKQDSRVIGMVLASGAVRAETRPTDPDLLAQSKRLVAEGRGDDLLRIPNRRFPSFVSADTFFDIANTPPDQKDFFGVQTPNPGVTRVLCPLLAFFGTKEPDIGTEADLELLKSCVERQSSGPSRVQTVMIQNADHMYTGETVQVAETIAKWADGLLPESGKGQSQPTR